MGSVAKKRLFLVDLFFYWVYENNISKPCECDDLMSTLHCIFGETLQKAEGNNEFESSDLDALVSHAILQFYLN